MGELQEVAWVSQEVAHSSQTGVSQCPTMMLGSLRHLEVLSFWVNKDLQETLACYQWGLIQPASLSSGRSGSNEGRALTSKGMSNLQQRPGEGSWVSEPELHSKEEWLFLSTLAQA